MSAEIVTLDAMPGLDFKGPFDELTELRGLLSTQEIADFTGLRRETISRARPDRPFRRRTEEAIGNLYLVVTRMRSAANLETGQIAPVLRRPQPELEGRSIADLVRAGEVAQVLQHLAVPEAVKGAAASAPSGARARAAESREEMVEAFLAVDPEMAALLPEIEAKLRDYFAPVRWVERGVGMEAGAEDVLYLWAHNDLPYDENEKRFRALLEAEREFLRPVRSRLNLGFLR